MQKLRMIANLVIVLMVFSVYLPGALPVQAGFSQQSSQQSAVIALSSWGYEDVTVRGPFAQAEYTFGLPYHWQVQPGSRLDLGVRFLTGGPRSQPANTALGQQANIQVKLNGVAIYETFISTGDQTLEVALPDAWPVREGEYDSLEVFLRDYGPCEDALFSSLTILSASRLIVNYLPGPLKLNLADYPAPFYQRSYLPNVVNVVLPDDPSSLVLQSAFSVVAGLGNVSGNRVDVRMVHAGQVSPEILETNLFLIGMPDSNSLIAQVQGKPSQSAAETDGVIRLLPSPWKLGKAILVITGATDEGVHKAALSLSARPQFLGLTGQEAVVQDVRADLIQPPAQPLNLTFSELGYTERVVTGIGRKDIYYNFDLPLDWNLTSDANVRFIFSHSPLLDGALSSITLFLNDRPIGSVRLDETNVTNGELIASLPPESSLPGLSNSLLVQIEADLPDPCILPETTTAWITLSAESSLYLAHTGQDESSFFNLDFWPRPFNADPRLKDVLISLPADPTPEEYSTAFRIVSFLGAASQGQAFEPVVLLGDPAGMDLSPYKIIAIGKPTRNPLLRSVNDNLPQPFVSGSDTIEQKIDNVVYRLPDGLDLGFLELIPSPWNADSVLVVITGTSDAGLQSAASFIMNSGRIWEMKGNLAMLRDETLFATDTRTLTAEGQGAPVATAVTEITPVTPLTAGEKPVSAVIEQPESRSLLVRNPFILPALAVGSLVVVVALLGLGFWLSRRSKKLQ